MAFFEKPLKGDTKIVNTGDKLSTDKVHGGFLVASCIEFGIVVVAGSACIDTAIV